MFCTSCGAQAQETDLFCPACGARLKHSSGTVAQTASNSYAQPTTDVNPFAQTATMTAVSKKKKANKGAGVIAALMILVVLAMLIFAGVRGYFDDVLEGMSCSGGDQDIVTIGSSPVSDSDEVSETDAPGFVLPDDEQQKTTTATTTTTTEKPTTTTTVDAKKQEAEEIRKLLVSKTWSTELEGYKATIKFNKDGTATITVKVLFVSQSIDAEYSVNDKCHAVIIGEYGGNTYGVSGDISKVSDTKLVVERDKNMGKLTLTAAK